MTDSGSFQADYEALNGGDGYYRLKDWSVVEMTGKDRQAFLHNMCTNDIRSLSSGNACEAFCTNVKGKIIAHVLVIAHEDRIELLAVPGQADSLIAHLDRYIIREAVKLTDATRDTTWCYCGYHEIARDSSPSAAAASTTVAGDSVGLPGFLVRGDTQSDRQRCSFEAWEAVRIEAAFPLFGVDFDNSNLPQEDNRDHLAINFNKGCYLGQETIARIDALGHVNQRIVLLHFAGESLPDVGEELHANGNLVGHVTSRCWSPKRQSPIALAMVRRGSNEQNTQLESAVGTATVI